VGAVLKVPPQLGEYLSRALADPDVIPRSTIGPTLSYGRHRGPSPTTARIAAVAIALYRDDRDRWTIPLTLRPTTLSHHGGQISLPGGQVEPGEDALAAAVREFHEELGVRPVVRQVCGELPIQYVYASDNRVHPVVMIIDRPTQNWQPDPAEVAEVVPMPVSVLTDPSARREVIKARVVRSGGGEVGELSFRASGFQLPNHHVWGATAMILDQLAQLLLREDCLSA
jgi:8-oxo-dGTP pyrophosphatase MutT (NUDIX family)